MKKLISYFRNHFSEIYKAVIFFISMAIIVSFLPREGKFKYDFQRGKPWKHSDLIAPFDFAILKSEEAYRQETEGALSTLKPYFTFSHEIVETQREKLISTFENQAADKEFGLLYTKDLYRHICITLFEAIMDSGLTPDVIQSEEGIPYQSIRLIKDKIATEISLTNLFSPKTALEYANQKLERYPGIDKAFITTLLQDNIVPNIVPDLLKTEQQRQQLLASVSKWHGMIQHGERIISKGEIITSEKHHVLLSLKDEYESQAGSSSTWFAILLGQVILVIISMLALALFLYFFRNDLFSNNKKLILILLQIVSMVVITSMVVSWDIAFIYLVPLCIVPIIVSSFFDTRLALFVHVVAIINVGFLVPNSFEFVFMQLFTGIITIISIVKLYKRSQFFFTSVYIFLTYSSIYVGLSLVHEGGLGGIDYRILLLFAGSALLTLLANPLIYIFEKVFGMITDVSLMEYSDTNNVLLRELANKAPGTFQHSIQVSNLAEEAVLAIKGNPMLARAGALYHDIGKMDMAGYFIENQSGGFNPHEELSYEESARLIISHVIRGVQKAKRFKIPEQIIDFIRTHHGTKRAEYFYFMQKQEFPDNELLEEDYTYRGPIPFSKETCVVMMADAVEAATRSLKNPDGKKINDLVDAIIAKHFDEGQFMNANITLRDISVVKKLFKRRLQNIYHLRIEYPE